MESRQPIVIEVRGGMVQEVRNVPHGFEYEIVDHDLRAEHEEPEGSESSGLPPDPEGMNDARADWAAGAVQTFQAITGADDEDVLSDLLADLMHWTATATTSKSRSAAPGTITTPRHSETEGDCPPG